MLAAENFHPPALDDVVKGAEYEAEFHGYDGPVQVSFAEGMFGAVQLQALQAAQTVWTGLRRIADLATGHVNRVGIIANMLDPDVQQNRSSPYTAFIKGEPERRRNLVILLGHRVTQIRWKEDTSSELIAEGVEFQASPNSTKLFAKADKEVLLAAGSMRSPQLLELSGVGDPVVLEAADVPVRMALPAVGRNLQEQTKSTLSYVSNVTDFRGTGPASALAFPNVHQLLRRSSNSIYRETLQGLPAYAENLYQQGRVANTKATLLILQKQLANLFEDSEASTEIFFDISPGTGTIGAAVWNPIPMARGTIHIRSYNSFDQPEVEPAYFGHPLDLAIQRPRQNRLGTSSTRLRSPLS